jgi:flagellar basal-body rod modification protein FlgD
MASTTSSSSSGNSATISANDFLTLLVTEMQNQDPTADSDPNEYINQLVQVNSLEQLIDINQTLSTDLGGTSSSASGSSASGQVSSIDSSTTGKTTSGTAAQILGTGQKSNLLSALQAVASGSASAGGNPALSAGIKQTPGNLSIPEDRPAAHRVAHSLAGSSRAR